MKLQRKAGEMAEDFMDRRTPGKPQPTPFSLPAEDINLMAEIATRKYNQLQEQDGLPSLQDQAMLGAALVSFKQAMKHGEYQRFIRERLPFTTRSARRFVVRLQDFLDGKHLIEEPFDPAPQNEEEAEVDRRMRELLWPPEALKKRKEKKALRWQPNSPSTTVGVTTHK